MVIVAFSASPCHNYQSTMPIVATLIIGFIVLDLVFPNILVVSQDKK
jgi:hypothetical protein